MTDIGPTRVSDKKIEINLVGHLMPWSGDQPVYLCMAGTTDIFIPVFSTSDKLRAFMAFVKIDYERIRQITNTNDFFESTLGKCRVAVDPYMHENGRFRWIEPFGHGAEA